MASVDDPPNPWDEYSPPFELVAYSPPRQTDVKRRRSQVERARQLIKLLGIPPDTSTAKAYKIIRLWCEKNKQPSISRQSVGRALDRHE
jgi:hypothetical protein